MPGEAIQKHENERFVVALLPDGGARRFDKKENAPEGSTTFEGIEDLGKMTVADLDKITSKILKAPVGSSKNKEEAVDRAWTALLAATANPPAEEPRGRGARPARISNTVFKLQYDFDSPGKNEEKFNQLPPQARTILKIMAKGGKKEYSESELRKLIEENGKQLETVQEPWRIFQYYRRLLSEKKFMAA